jgi:hypothetical protein
MIDSSSSVLVTEINSAALSAHEGTGAEGANRQTTKAPLRTDNSNLAGIGNFSHVLALQVVSIDTAAATLRRRSRVGSEDDHSRDIGRSGTSGTPEGERSVGDHGYL